MDLMLPAPYSSGLSLADVLPSSLAAVHGETNALGLPRIERAVVILADGLGATALKARAGHARHLAARLGRSSIIESGFPTTTAAGLTTLCTGVTPGRHGMVGYRVLDAAHDRTVNQLNGWDERIDPTTWQRQPTVFERAGSAGVPSYAIGRAKHSDSGFTRAVLRGARYVAAQSIADRFAAARRLLDEGGAALVYLYVHELDVAAHAYGWESEKWLAQLETLDAEIAAFGAGLRAREAALVTADHGVLDVPATSQVLFDTVPGLLDGVRHVGGEPRCVQLYLEPDAPAGQADALAASWREAEGTRAWVATRAEAVAAGWFGPVVEPEVLPRIGDVIVAARKRVTYYDSRASASSRRMIGQHGSLTPEETRVPLIRLGAFER
jgi:hypothetical protein